MRRVPKRPDKLMINQNQIVNYKGYRRRLVRYGVMIGLLSLPGLEKAQPPAPAVTMHSLSHCLRPDSKYKHRKCFLGNDEGGPN
jgi:hypothetical protein